MDRINVSRLVRNKSLAIDIILVLRILDERKKDKIDIYVLVRCGIQSIPEWTGITVQRNILHTATLPAHYDITSIQRYFPLLL